MLTPDQLKEHSFTAVENGRYSAEEVNRYFGEVIASYNQMYRENGELIRKISILANKVQDYRRDEDNIRNALLNAQRSAESVIAQANKTASEIISCANKEMADIVSGKDGIVTKANDEADKIISEARVKAENIVAEAVQQTEEINFSAKTEASEITENAKKTAETTLQKANNEAIDIITYARKEAEELKESNKAANASITAEIQALSKEKKKLESDNENLLLLNKKLAAEIEKTAELLASEKKELLGVLSEKDIVSAESISAEIDAVIADIEILNNIAAERKADSSENKQADIESSNSSDLSVCEEDIAVSDETGDVPYAVADDDKNDTADDLQDAELQSAVTHENTLQDNEHTAKKEKTDFVVNVNTDYFGDFDDSDAFDDFSDISADEDIHGLQFDENENSDFGNDDSVNDSADNYSDIIDTDSLKDESEKDEQNFDDGFDSFFSTEYDSETDTNDGFFVDFSLFEDIPQEEPIKDFSAEESIVHEEEKTKKKKHSKRKKKK